jgi:hypothetical protein
LWFRQQNNGFANLLQSIAISKKVINNEASARKQQRPPKDAAV